MVDSHLRYVRVPNLTGRYDVYSRDGGLQLGWVERRPGAWEAWDFRTQELKRGGTRWQVATALWGDAPRGTA
jgi:hypothetical protein